MVSALEILQAVVEGGVHFVRVLGEEGEDRGTVFNLKRVDFSSTFMRQVTLSSSRSQMMGAETCCWSSSFLA